MNAIILSITIVKNNNNNHNNSNNNISGASLSLGADDSLD